MGGWGVWSGDLSPSSQQLVCVFAPSGAIRIRRWNATRAGYVREVRLSPKAGQWRRQRRGEAAAARSRGEQQASAGAQPWEEEKGEREGERREQARLRRVRTAADAGRHRRAGRPSPLLGATERGECVDRVLEQRRTRGLRMLPPSPVQRRDGVARNREEGRLAQGPRVERQQRGDVAASKDPVGECPDDAADAQVGRATSAVSSRRHAQRVALWRRAPAA